jgi:hypothetical protein
MTKFLFNFLYDLSKFSETTSMDENNLAIVFGPNLLRPPEEGDPTARLKETTVIQAVCSSLLPLPSLLYPPSSFILHLPILHPSTSLHLSLLSNLATVFGS